MTATLELSSQPQRRRQYPPSPAERQAWLSPETLVFLTVWLLLMAAGRERLFQDPGTFWHTAVGEQMLSTGELVRHDSFTFTFAGQPWLAHQWLGECLMALAFRVGGWDALLLGTATLLAGFYAWLAYRWRTAGAGPIVIAAMLATVFLASAHHYHVRPHLASIVLLAGCFSLLCDVENGRLRLTRLAWLVPLFVLWTSLHGGMLGGLATIAVAVVGWTVAKLFGWPSPLKTWRDAALACVVLLACAGTMFLSPFGVEMPRAWLTIMQLSLPDVIQEHARIDFARPEGWMVLVLGFGYAIALWRTPGWRVTWLIPLLWLVLACDRVRHAPLFAVVVAIAGAELIRRSHVGTIRLTRPRFAAPLALIAVCLVFPAAGVRWAKHDPQIWPIELLGDLKRLESESPGARVFNTLHYGGFLAFHTPGLRTFIDDRCELFGDAFLRGYAQAERERPQQIDAWHREYDFGHALVRRSSPLERYLADHPHWRPVRSSGAATLYERVP